MKTNLFRVFVPALVAVAAASAQNTTSLQATIPFDFIVGQRTLPAGHYAVNQGGGQGTLVIKSDDGRGAAIVFANALYSTVPKNSGRLVFHRYGDTYFLSEVWAAGNDGRQIPSTNRERELKAGQSSSGAVVVAAAR
jgi:hypothetical protein